MKITTKTISLGYSAREDRMKLLINKNEKECIEFWITRRFYFSLLFELETFLEKLNIDPVRKTQAKKKKIEESSAVLLKKTSNTISILLENIHISFIKERKEFIFIFKSDLIETESVFAIPQFLHFYSILKSSFPKGEWGII